MRQDNRQFTAEYTQMAEGVIAALDTRYLKALTDPTRVEVIKRLVLIGASDVGTIAAGLSKDRSVVSRHLNVLEQAGIMTSRREGRRVLYDIDGPYVVQKTKLILESLKPMELLCRPFENLESSEKLDKEAAA